MKIFCAAAIVLTLSAVAARAAENTLTEKELSDGWILLFDGESTFGWQAEGKANWKAADGKITVSEGEPSFLYTTTQFTDYVLKVDFRYDRDTNSGVFLHTAKKPTDPSADCYELNIAAPHVSPFPTGSFVRRKKAEQDFDSREWQTFTVTVQGGSVSVKVNDALALEYDDPAPLKRGHISLQFNQGAVEFRNIKLQPLSLESIFNGKDLEGWTVFPGEKSVYSVTDEGHINVKNGRGQLESHGQYADFALQLEVFSNGTQLNSGIFFRSIPGEFWNGYECQIHNGYKNNDRTQPVDCGTGGFYRRQNARKVVANDGEWFHITLIADGPHMTSFVNGYQVSDWTDTRAADANPRKGLRLEKGTLIIQGHDPTTDLSFRNLRIAPMPERASK